MALGTAPTFVLIQLEENTVKKKKYFFMACRVCTEERAYMNVKYVSLQWDLYYGLEVSILI